MSKIYFTSADSNPKDFSNLGRVEFEGRHYRLLDQAMLTGRCLPDSQSDTHFEMSAPAVAVFDDASKEYTVYWIFESIEDAELDSYNYDNIDRIEED